MGRRSAQDIDEGLLGFLPPIQRAEQNRALDFGLDGVIPDGLARQKLLELPQPRFLRQPGSPVALVAGNVGQGSRVLFQSGHDAQALASGALGRRIIC